MHSKLQTVAHRRRGRPRIQIRPEARTLRRLDRRALAFCMSGSLDPGLIDFTKALARMNAARDLATHTRRNPDAHCHLRPLQQSAAEQPID